MTDQSIRPFRIDIPRAALLDDLRERLAALAGPWRSRPGLVTGRPGRLSQIAHRLLGRWLRLESGGGEAQRAPQFTTDVDGQRLHFAHVRSSNPDATPLLLLHDWPASMVSCSSR